MKNISHRKLCFKLIPKDLMEGRQSKVRGGLWNGEREHAISPRQ